MAKMLKRHGFDYVASTDVEGLGHVFDDEEENSYRWVYTSASDIAINQPVCFVAAYSASASSKLFKHYVIKPAAIGDTFLFAGVAMSAASASNYFWVKRRGFHSAGLVGGEAGSAGTPMYVTSAGSPTKFSMLNGADGGAYKANAILLTTASTLAAATHPIYVNAI